ncbi:hypothetical protein DFQ27_007031 [Actinomortierella ambigua]|uniref:Uncharacterized protein n=1 Tax=Actinomortierella ambigua TaxID=1343610 RepID=A0A9P6PUR0_9FUNG|nr:hypothetical protein DFQ27_007031 [Actinomortierella ambigua]
MSSSSRNSLTEKDQTALPYPESETEYLSVSRRMSKESSYVFNEKGQVVKDADPEDRVSFEEYQYDSLVKPHQPPLYRRRKFWIWCGVITVVFLAIFIPLLIFVIIPAIAQSVLNGSTMTLVQLNMTSPSETNMDVSMNVQVGGIPSIFNAKLDFTEEILISWNNRLIGAMTLQQVEVTKGKGSIQQVTAFSIKDGAAFADFTKSMVADETFTWTLKSKANLHTLGRDIKDLNVEKDLKMQGSNFAGLRIQKFDMPSAAPDGSGALLSVTAVIANPSPIGMPLGTLTLDLSYEGTALGRVVAKGVQLVGGQDMVLQLDGVLLKQVNQADLDRLSVMISNYVANKVTLTTAKTVSVLPDGVTPISWLTTALTSSPMVIPLVSPEPLKVIQSLAIKDMGLSMRPEAPWAPTAFSNAVQADFKLPFAIPVTITALSNTIMTLSFKGKALADLTTAVWNQTVSDMANNKIVFTLPPSPLNIKDDAHESFQNFLVDVVQNTDTGFDVKGSADAIATTPMGIVQLKVPFETAVALKGIGFATAKPAISNVTVVGGNTDHVLLDTSVGINNPSIFTVDVGPVKLRLQGTVRGLTDMVGDVLVPNLKFGPGLTALQSQIMFKPQDEKFRDAFFSEYMASNRYAVEITGDDQSSTIESLKPAMAALKLVTDAPGLEPKVNLIAGANGTPTLGSVLGNRQIGLTVQAVNPLKADFALNGIVSNVFWKGHFFGQIISGQPFTVGAGQTVTSPNLIMQAPTGFQFGWFMTSTFLPQNLGVLNGAIVPVDMVGNFSVSVGGPAGAGYASGLEYKQDNLQAFMKLDISFTGMRRRRLTLDGDEEENVDVEERRILAQAGPEPSTHDAEAYIQWLKRRLIAEYPEEAKLYAAEHGPLL